MIECLRPNRGQDRVAGLLSGKALIAANLILVITSHNLSLVDHGSRLVNNLNQLVVELLFDQANTLPRVISRICICCGEPFSFGPESAPDNPNICGPCSQMSGELFPDSHFDPHVFSPNDDSVPADGSRQELKNAS